MNLPVLLNPAKLKTIGRQGLPEHLKGVTNDKGSMKRWGRLVEAKPSAKETIALTCAKDYRYPEKAKSVQIIKVKKNKLK